MATVNVLTARLLPPHNLRLLAVCVGVVLAHAAALAALANMQPSAPMDDSAAVPAQVRVSLRAETAPDTRSTHQSPPAQATAAPVKHTRPLQPVPRPPALAAPSQATRYQTDAATPSPETATPLGSAAAETSSPPPFPFLPAQPLPSASSLSLEPTADASAAAPAAAAAIEPTAAEPSLPDPRGQVASLGTARPDVVLPSSNAAHLHNPAPAYPALSRRLGEQGRVVLRVRIEADGRPSALHVHASSGYARLDQAALKAVARWRFVPGTRQGVPEAMWFHVPLQFVLE